MADERLFSHTNISNSSEKISSNSGTTLLLVRAFEEAKIAFGIIVMINLIVIVLGIIVNAVIFYVMVRGKRYKRNGSNLFIMHLSVMELIYRFFLFPIIITFTVPTSGIKSVQCKSITFFSTTCASAIFVSLVAIAADRYQNIVHPLETLNSKRKPVLLVCLVWLYASIVSCPVVISVESISVLEISESRGMTCDDDCADNILCDIPQSPLGQSSTTSYFLLAFVVPLTVMSVLYTKVAIFLHQRSNNGKMHKVATRSRNKAVRMLVMIVFGYVLTLGPSVVFTMLRSYGLLNDTSFDVMLLVSWVVEFASYSSSLGNPLIYAFYNGDFRKELVRLIPKRRSKKVNSYTVTFTHTSRNNNSVTQTLHRKLET